MAIDVVSNSRSTAPRSSSPRNSTRCHPLACSHRNLKALNEEERDVLLAGPMKSLRSLFGPSSLRLAAERLRIEDIYVDCPTSPSPALYLRGRRDAGGHPRHRARSCSMPTDIFPGHQYPRHLGRVQLHRHGARWTWRSASSRNFERIVTTTVNDIEHIESQSLYGIGMIKIYFQKNANIDDATAAGDRDRADRHSPDAARHAAAADHSLQRFGRADSCSCPSAATRCPKQNLFDLAVNFLRRDLVDRARRGDPLSLRRQAAAGDGRSRPGKTLRVRHFRHPMFPMP